MIAAAVLALALSAPSPYDAERDALIARWTAAQQRAIAGIRNPKARAAAARAFAVQRRSLPAAAFAPAGVPRDFSSLAKRELATPGRYQLSEEAVAAATEPWWLRALDWLRDRWNAFWDDVFGRAKLSRTQSEFVGTFLIALFAFIVLLLAARLLANLQFARRARASAVRALDSPAQAKVLYVLACERADAGDYGSAAKLLFAATAAALDLRGDVRDRTSATVREMRATLRQRNASAVVSFDEIARPFVASAYAERPVRGEEWSAARYAYLLLAPEGAR